MKIKHIIIKNLTLLLFVFFIGESVLAQKQENDFFTVNVFVAADKTIYVEKEKTKFKNVEKEVSTIVRKKPFKLDQPVVYRIFADENLDMGYIIDVSHELTYAYDENVRMERFLLNTVELNIDGKNWFDAIDMKKLKKVN